MKIETTQIYRHNLSGNICLYTNIYTGEDEEVKNKVYFLTGIFRGKFRDYSSDNFKESFNRVWPLYGVSDWDEED